MRKIYKIMMALLTGIYSYNGQASDQEGHSDHLKRLIKPANIFPDEFYKKPNVDLKLLLKIQRYYLSVTKKLDTKDEAEPIILSLKRVTFHEPKFMVFLMTKHPIHQEVSNLKKYTIDRDNEVFIKKISDPKAKTYRYDILNLSKRRIAQFWLTLIAVKIEDITTLSTSQKQNLQLYFNNLDKQIYGQAPTLHAGYEPTEIISDLLSQRMNACKEKAELASSAIIEKALEKSETEAISSSHRGQEHEKVKKLKRKGSRDKTSEPKEIPLDERMKKLSYAEKSASSTIIPVKIKDLKKSLKRSKKPLKESQDKDNKYAKSIPVQEESASTAAGTALKLEHSGRERSLSVGGPVNKGGISTPLFTTKHTSSLTESIHRRERSGSVSTSSPVYGDVKSEVIKPLTLSPLMVKRIKAISSSSHHEIQGSSDINEDSKISPQPK